MGTISRGTPRCSQPRGASLWRPFRPRASRARWRGRREGTIRMDATAPLPDDVTPGDPRSPVGLCTLWTRQERILRGVPRELYAVCGNLYSLWGIIALVAHGMADDGRIAGTEARLDVSGPEVEQFRRQVRVVDLRGCTSAERVAAAIRSLPAAPHDQPRVIRPEGVASTSAEPPPRPVGAPTAGGSAAAAEPSGRTAARGSGRFVPDPLGNFLIAVAAGEIVAAHATTTGGPTGQRFVGRAAADVYRAIIAAGLVSQLDHAAYLGAELARAEIALRAGLPYRQDSPLRLPEQQ